MDYRQSIAGFAAYLTVAVSGQTSGSKLPAHRKVHHELQ
jgi:hypothetical protein